MATDAVHLKPILPILMPRQSINDQLMYGRYVTNKKTRKKRVVQFSGVIVF